MENSEVKSPMLQIIPTASIFRTNPFCFEITVANCDDLPIPYIVAWGYLPYPAGVRRLSEQELPLQLTDPSNDFNMTLPYIPFDAEGVFIGIRLWADQMKDYHIRPGDKIRFFRPEQNLSQIHFRIQHIPRPDNAPPFQIYNVNFIHENFLWRRQITEQEIVTDRLVMHPYWMEIFFRWLPRVDGYEEIAKFTDNRNKDWYLTVAYKPGDNIYSLEEGWGHFMREYELIAGDFVGFFRPNFPHCHGRHFLIQFQRRGQHMVGGSREGPGPVRSGGKAKMRRYSPL